MNQITKSFMKDFIKSQELASEGDDKDFEKFSCYCVMRKFYGHEFDLDEIVVGKSGDIGIDGIGIIVNGKIVNSEEEIDCLIEQNHYLSVTYIIVQSKISENFDSSEIGTFCRGVEDFFLENYHLEKNNEIENKKKLVKYITDHAINLENNPKCFFYFVCNGKWSSGLTDHAAILENTRKTLIEASVFSSVIYRACGADEINSLYKESKNRIAVSIDFSAKVTFPKNRYTSSAYIGILPFSEFKKLIVDDDGCIRYVFDDNVRDFLDFSNSVNKKIDDTLQGEHYELFPLLNNGVTVVAERIQQTGDTMILFDYQIVNGCQTSNVLAKYIGEERLDTLPVPVKIIVTNSEETKSNITLATNNQTPVKREQMVAFTSFQRNLEDFYNAKQDDAQLVYERRVNQYASKDIPRAKIITVPNQIKAFASMFLRKPHRVTSYYGELTKNIADSSSEIFHQEHLQLTYYLAGLAFYRLDILFKNGTIDRKHKKIRFFILLGFVVSVIHERFEKNDFTVERTNKKKTKPLVELLKDSYKTAVRFAQVISCIEATGIVFNKESLKLSSTTEAIIQACQAYPFTTAKQEI